MKNPHTQVCGFFIATKRLIQGIRETNIICAAARSL